MHIQHSNQFRFHLLQVNTGSLTYPKYQINSSRSIFNTREKFIQYTNVSEMEKEFDLYVERKQYNEAYKIYLKIREKLISLMEKIVLEGDSLVWCCFFCVRLFFNYLVDLFLLLSENSGTGVYRKRKSFHLMNKMECHEKPALQVSQKIYRKRVFFF